VIDNKPWPVIVPLNKDLPGTQTTFNMEPLPTRRTNMLSWPGTKGISNLVMDLRASDVMGEFWVNMRIDESVGQAVRVGFFKGAVVVDQEFQMQSTRVAAFACPDLNDQIKTTIRIWGNDLRITINGHELPKVHLIETPFSPTGTLALSVYDHVRGVAQAKSINALVQPVQENPKS
jgi:hypothetical protein